MKKLLAPLLTILLLGTVNGQTCPPEDCYSFESSSTPIIESGSLIGGPTVPLVNVDFNALPVGPITMASIISAFPGANIKAIEFSPLTPSFGIYNFRVSNNGLARTGASLAIIDNTGSDAFDEVGSIRITFHQPITEIGHIIADWSGPFNVEIRNTTGGNTTPGTLVNVVTYNTGSFPVGHYVYIQDPLGFDQVVFTALPAIPGADWLLAGLQVEDLTTPVPTVSEWGLIFLGISFLGIASIVLYRRRDLVTA